MPVVDAPRYEIQSRLGSGGMGVVYLATHETPAGRRQVAIKRLGGGEALDQADARDRLVAEARLVFQLTHGNICQVHDLAVSAEGTFVVMEYVRGLDLAGLLRALRRDRQELDVASAIHVARETARALHYAHRRTDEAGRPLFLVHGDVTPRNILLSVEGEVKLADFGIARAIGVAAPGEGLVGGTPGYIAPEAGSPGADHRVDIYALGGTLYAALAGEPPVAGRAIDTAALRGRRPEVSAEPAGIVARMTAPDPGARYLAASDVEVALSRELASRWPDFTPSVLAESVSSRQVSQRSAPEAAHAELLSVVATTPAEPRALSSVLSSLAQPTAPTAPRGRATRTAVPDAPARRGRAALWLALGLLLLAGGATAFVLAERGQGAARAAAADAAPAPASAAAAVAATPVADGAPSQELARSPDAAPPALVAAAAPPRDRRAARDRRKPAPREKPAAPPADVAATTPGSVTVNSTPWGAVYIDGKRVAEETPLYQHPLRPGRYRIKVFFPDRAAYSAEKTVTIHAGESVAVAFRAR